VTGILRAFLERAGLQQDSMRRPELEKIAQSVGCDDLDGFIEATAKVCGLSWDQGERADGWLELHSDQWCLTLTAVSNREGLTLVILAAMLVREGLADGTIGWVAQVLPALIDLDAIKVRDDDGLLAVQLAVRQRLLPQHLQETVNPLDFAEFSATVARAAADGSLLIRS
jgi:hypothetical protein